MTEMDSASFFTTTEVWRRGGVEEDSSLDGPQRLAASFSVASQEEDQEECGNEDSDDEASFWEVEESSAEHAAGPAQPHRPSLISPFKFVIKTLLRLHRCIIVLKFN